MAITAESAVSVKVFDHTFGRCAAKPYSRNQGASGKKIMGKISLRKKARNNRHDSAIEHRERMLDDALMQSFPASDPPAISSALDWLGNNDGPDAEPEPSLDKGGASSIFNSMSERSQFGRPQLHPGSSTARF
jgi:hypothetical protein